VRTPLHNPDFARYLQRIKDSKPDAVFVFLPPGSQTIAFVKGYDARGLKQAGVRLIGTGDLTDDGVLQAMGEPTLGRNTSGLYPQGRKGARRTLQRRVRPVPDVKDPGK
jgi:branched-chain amino acid transport system substrate-binding protein